jgi:hypothetical protein
MKNLFANAACHKISHLQDVLHNVIDNLSSYMFVFLIICCLRWGTPSAIEPVYTHKVTIYSNYIKKINVLVE